MRHSEFVGRLNFGVIVRAGKVTDDPNAPTDNLQRRERLLNSYTVVGTKFDALFGIKPVSMTGENKLDVLWSISALRQGDDGRLFSVSVEHMTDNERSATSSVKERLVTMENEDQDIDAVFGELQLHRYQIPGEVNDE